MYQKHKIVLMQKALSDNLVDVYYVLSKNIGLARNLVNLNFSWSLDLSQTIIYKTF
jgi:hypothetical protein